MGKNNFQSLLHTTAQHASHLKELGIEKIEDFLVYFPWRYTDQRDVSRIIDALPNTPVTLQGKMLSVTTKRAFRRGMSIVQGVFSDASGTLPIVWFNKSYLGRTLTAGQEVMLGGKITIDAKKGFFVMKNPTIEIIKPEQIHTARIVPIYHETEKISSPWIREKLFPLLPYAEKMPEFLPEEIREKYHLIGRSDAIKNAHFPASEKALEEAKRRLSFEELFLLQLAALKRKYLFRRGAGGRTHIITPDWELIKKFSETLPWQLTAAQKKAVYEIITDMSKEYPMSRLLEGDTGSGKTVVGAAAALHAIKAGFQVCLLAPTEILASQHAKTLTKVLAPFDITPILLTGSKSAAEKKKRYEEIQKGEAQLLVGTHALLQDEVLFKKLGLVLIDEQHRFGVRQRELLRKQGTPHILHLTATPIPRTLALVVYGDQELSVLDEMPPGRQEITTRIVPEEKRSDAYAWIAGEIGKGRQAFIIFPLVHESQLLELKAATGEYERLQESIFPELKLGLLHGQMKAEDKDAAMKKFSAGEIDILVSTAVVEVGVDVPNATIMMIEGAERFGLAQLHQFRGRVGRGKEKSYCLLFPTSHAPHALKRLDALTRFHSGFKLAEIDLELRGPGEVYGIAQSGIADLKMARLTDAVTIKETREAAQGVIDEDPELEKYPALKIKINEQENIAIDY